MKNDPQVAPGIAAEPLVVSRTFAAPRELVFQAWSSAERVQQWFCPAGYIVPQAQVDFRIGGAFHVCMRSASGQDHWTRGTFTEIVPQTRLVIDMKVPGADARNLFRALTVVRFMEVAGGTRMEVEQSYTLFDPSAAPMIKGATLGWAQTLDRLEQALARLAPAALPGRRSVLHGTFRIEREFAAVPARVFRALSDPKAKAQWFTGGEGYTELDRELDVRNGGRELLKGRWPSGLVSTFEAVYHDVVSCERIVYAYTMHLGDRKISVSLATVELTPAGAGTRFVLTEQGAFLDGYDDVGARERGSNHLLDALGASLAT